MMIVDSKKRVQRSPNFRSGTDEYFFTAVVNVNLRAKETRIVQDKIVVELKFRSFSKPAERAHPKAEAIPTPTYPDLCS